MQNTATQVNKIVQQLPQLKIVQRKVKNPHLAQVYIRTGQGPTGPWVGIGINENEYLIGFK